jgi:hypothetical protein
MTRQNRVTPFGEIVAVAAPGTMMGNRGCLHDAGGRIVRSSARDQWLICRLQWKDILRSIMTPGKYTELFFLDEATALAAGHRPCNDCRSDRLAAFKAAWATGVDGAPAGATVVNRIDPVLKRDRGTRNVVQVRLGELPDGVMMQLAREEHARLKWRGRLFRWTPTGYEDPRPVDGSLQVSVLTPACSVKVLAAGVKSCGRVGREACSGIYTLHMPY